MTLVEFLRARLDEDEQAAWNANSTVWPSREVQVELDDPEHFAWRSKELSPAMARHIVRHDPARVLAEVEAKRRIVDAYEAAGAAWQEAVSDPPAAPDVIHKATATLIALELAARSLSDPYADHPDYDPGWRPARGDQLAA